MLASKHHHIPNQTRKKEIMAATTETQMANNFDHQLSIGSPVKKYAMQEPYENGDQEKIVKKYTELVNNDTEHQGKFHQTVDWEDFE